MITDPLDSGVPLGMMDHTIIEMRKEIKYYRKTLKGIIHSLQICKEDTIIKNIIEQANDPLQKFTTIL